MHSQISLSFTLIFLFLSPFSINAATTNKAKGFSIDLIHRDSPLSPFYNSSMTHSERVQNAALRSMSRANRFGQSSSSMAATRKLVETEVVRPNDASYLMKISVGTPPIERWAFVDTGSDLIWFQCSPCPKCSPQKAKLFDPKSSSTYTSLSCSSEQCKSLSHFIVQGQSYPNCGTSNKCTYFYLYGDTSYTMGELGTESISFGQAALFPKTVFGCGHNNQLALYGSNSGCVGLGQGALSLVSQIGKIGRKFSYCLPPYSPNITFKLRFGEDATISENGFVSTPLIASSEYKTYYILNLEGITVGQQKVPLIPSQSNGNIIIDSGTTYTCIADGQQTESLTNQSNGNIIIDSGTTLTLLPSSFYYQVEALVKQAIGADQFIVQNNNYKLCYTNAINSIQNVPNFEVHFTGANLSLKPKNLFRMISNDVICFAMLPTEGQGIYGNVAQTDFEVEYDLDQKKVSFAPVDCTKQ